LSTKRGKSGFRIVLRRKADVRVSSAYRERGGEALVQRKTRIRKSRDPGIGVGTYGSFENDPKKR